jgi:hypothetical protein
MQHQLNMGFVQPWVQTILKLIEVVGFQQSETWQKPVNLFAS